MDEESDEGDDDDHHAGERIEEITPVGGEIHKARGSGHGAGRDPLKKNLLIDSRLICGKREEFKDGASGVQEGEKHATDTKEIHGVFLQTAPQKKHECCAAEWEDRE